MAGLSLYYEDSQDDLEEFGFEEYNTDGDGERIASFLDLPNQDELTPLSRLEKYAASTNVFNRQIVARGLLDVLRAFSDDEQDFTAVMETIVRLSDDTEPTVRAELMEQVPHLAMFLQENRPSFPMAFSNYLVPVVVRYLTDPNNQDWASCKDHTKSTMCNAEEDEKEPKDLQKSQKLTKVSVHVSTTRKALNKNGFHGRTLLLSKQKLYCTSQVCKDHLDVPERFWKNIL